MNVENSGQSQPTNCVSCKSFYGSEANSWMCSVCYKKKNSQESVKSQTRVEPVKTETKVQAVETPVQQPKQADKSKCFACSKKIGIYGIECKCKLVFCNLHRMPEDHECSIDYRQLGKEKLAKEVKKVVAKKLSDI